MSEKESQTFYPPYISRTQIRQFPKTIWLFTKSDIKTMLIPATIFGSIMRASHQRASASASQTRSPMFIFLYVWIHLLMFCISNQRLPDAIKEDTENKPWRPIPSKRITPRTANTLLYITSALAFMTAKRLGGAGPSLALMLLGWLYSDMGLGDTSLVARNLLNGLLYMAFNHGAASVGCSGALGRRDFLWTTLIGLIVFTTAHAHDLADQAGDALNGRQTLPLIIGDWPARCVIAAVVTVWSVVCPAFFGLPWWGYVVPLLESAMLMGFLYVDRVNLRSKRPVKAYLLWIVTLYTLPLLRGW